MNKEDYELARPGQQPLPLVELRPGMNPEELYARTEKKEYIINKQTLASKRDDNPDRIRLKTPREPQTSFEIRVGTPDVAKENWSLLATHDDLDRAKAALDELKTTFPDRNYAMRKNVEMVAATNPKVWAVERQQTGEWEMPKWLDEAWVKPETHESLLHLSVGQPGNFAFYPTRAAAQNDKCAIMSAGQYMNENYGDVLTSAEIIKLVYDSDPPGDLVFSGSDGEAIATVYQTATCWSCMKKDNISLGRHPTTVYGAGDLEMVSLVRDGRIIARALCWPERKFVGCLYGDTVRFKIALECAGYSRDYKGNSNANTQGEGGFEGARLLKVRAGSSWLMPWIDLGYSVWDDGEFFRLSQKRGVNVSNTGNTYSGTIPFFDTTELEKAA